MAIHQTRKSRSARDMRRSHDHAHLPALSQDPTTGETHVRHHMTASGFYRGKQIKVIKAKAPKEGANDEALS